MNAHIGATHRGHRHAHRRRTDPGGHRPAGRTWAAGRWRSGASGSSASSTGSAPPSSTNRAARTSWSGRSSARRWTRPARRASSSSTTSAISACAATAPSAWSWRWRTWAASSPASIASKRPWAIVTATLHPERRGLRGECAQLSRPEGLHRRGARAWAGDRRRGLGRQLVFPCAEQRLRPAPGERGGAHRFLLAGPAGGQRAGFSRGGSRRVVRAADRAPARIRATSCCAPAKPTTARPCGTGTSAKLACLAADGKLAEGETWVQESIIGSTFTGTLPPRQGDRILPTITGTAFVNAEATLLLDDRRPVLLGHPPLSATPDIHHRGRGHRRRGVRGGMRAGRPEGAACWTAAPSAAAPRRPAWGTWW